MHHYVCILVFVLCLSAGVLAAPQLSGDDRQLANSSRDADLLLETLSYREVQSELGLTLNEMAPLMRVINEYNNRAMNQSRITTGKDISEEEHKTHKKERDRLIIEYRDRTKAMLKPKQFDRLRQISWQWNGAAALLDPTVMDSLKITTEQQERLNVLNSGYDITIGQIKSAYSALGAARTQNKLDIIFGERETAVFEVLNKDQQNSFNLLRGDYFPRAKLYR